MSDTFKLDLTHRPRRLRRTASLRALTEETVLRPANFIAPLFVIEGKGAAEPIASMPGVHRLNLADLVKECRALAKLGVPAVALFPKLDAKHKDEDGTAALHPDGLILRAVRAVKQAVPELTVITDIALDPYTTHGHDGVLNAARTDVENDRTVAILMKMAVLQARAGVDLVAPSDMMDGRVAAIRQALDAAGFTETGIMAYSAKFASAYYGPFRDAVGSAKAAGAPLLSKATYQLNPANRRAALIESTLDAAEGADIVMIKPAGPYLDIIREVRMSTRKPVAAYQVSGEYAQIHAAAKLGWLDYARCRHESLIAIKRAGADMILTYFAKEMAVELRCR
jgi:porphobilinogen synthase